MIFDGVTFSSLQDNKTIGNFKERALSALVDMIEKKLGVSVIYDAATVPYGRTDLLELWDFAALLKKHAIIRRFDRSARMPDEPPMCMWSAVCNIPTGHQVGGASGENEADALRATLAEALERYIWFSQTDYFKKPIRARTDQMSNMLHIPPEQFAGFTERQRSEGKNRQLRKDAVYNWTRGTSLVSGRPVYIPSQIVSGVTRDQGSSMFTEPVIRHATTIGLATWPTLAGARLSGVLEAIERDAYMIMWLNQLVLPRVDVTEVSKTSESLKRLVERCQRYGLKVHAIQMLTDAPTHAICVVVEDIKTKEPRFTVGLKAHRSLSYAIEKALTEALRARMAYRRYVASGQRWNVSIPVHDIGHRDRLYYWGVAEHAENLEFMISGPLKRAEPTAWDADSVEEQLQRVVDWCKKSNYECVAVSLGKSAKNPTPLHIEMVVIPQLQPTYLMEWSRAFGGTRWHEIPKKFGYTGLEEPFSATPHPFS